MHPTIDRRFLEPDVLRFSLSLVVEFVGEANDWDPIVDSRLLVEAIAEIERSRKVPPNMTWRSPRDGIVLERKVSDGMMMSAGETLFRIADISKLWVLADIPEHEQASLRLGAKATIRMRNAPDRLFSGTVSLIYPQVNMEARTTKVRIEVANPEKNAPTA